MRQTLTMVIITQFNGDRGYNLGTSFSLNVPIPAQREITGRHMKCQGKQLN